LRGRKRYKGNTTTISLWTNQPRVRPKATSTRRIQQQNNNKVQGQDTYLYALSGPTLSKANGHPPYKDKHDKGTTPTSSLWTNTPRVRPNHQGKTKYRIKYKHQKNSLHKT